MPERTENYDPGKQIREHVENHMRNIAFIFNQGKHGENVAELLHRVQEACYRSEYPFTGYHLATEIRALLEEKSNAVTS